MPNILTMFSREKLPPKIKTPEPPRVLQSGYLPVRRLLPISPLLWACAWHLGEARRHSNRNRAKHRDRGADLNQQGDTLGAFGELLVFFSAARHKQDAVTAYMRKHLYHPGGGSKTADTVDLPGIDVKSFGCEAHKSRIATNAQSHRHLKGQLDYYLFVLAPLWGKEALTSELIPWEEVSTWAEYPLGTYGDPSFNIHIDTFCQRYCPEASLFGLRANCYEEIEVKQNHNKARRLLASQIPTLR